MMGAFASEPGSREPSPDGLGPPGFDPSRGDDLRNSLNDQLHEMGCPYLVGDDRLEAWQAGYRAGLRFTMDLQNAR